MKKNMDVITIEVGEGNEKTHIKASKVVEKFYFLIWVLVTWVFILKLVTTLYIRFIYFSECFILTEHLLTDNKSLCKTRFFFPAYVNTENIFKEYLKTYKSAAFQ